MMAFLRCYLNLSQKSHMAEFLLKGQITFSRTSVRTLKRHSSTASASPVQCLLHATDEKTFSEIQSSFSIHPDFISDEEESVLYEEVQRYLKKLRYEFDHWDNAIHGFRETEKKEWSAESTQIINRMKDFAFTNAEDRPMPQVHVLDLAKNGYIKPHIDSSRFCGDTIAGVSLLSPCVMRLVHDKIKSNWADCLLERRSLYIMRGAARFDYTHEVLKEEDSKFMGTSIPRDRRISIISRTHPRPGADDTT